MFVDSDTEPREQRLRRKRWAMPKWLLKLIIRWAFRLGPLIYRLWRFFRSMTGAEDG